METKKNKEWWKSPRSLATGAAVLLFFITGYTVWFFEFRPYISTDDARISSDIVNIVNMGATAQINLVFVKEGDKVTNGMMLAELDHRTAEAQYRQARAKFELYNASYKRAETLIKKLAITKQQFDLSLSDLNVAKANLDLAEIAFERTYIKSPINGIVIRKIALSGNILEANQVALTVADIDNAWVSANISEKYINLVKLGQDVEVTVDEGYKLKGRVADICMAAASIFSLIPAESASGNFIKVVQRIPIKIELEKHPGKELRIGESAEIRIRI
jgi:membrane fusion protein (multidrug efflux system)